MEIHDKVKAIRKQLKMSQTAFAEELGIDYTTLSRIERGIFKPSYKFMENFNAVCRKYNINIEEAKAKNYNIVLKTIQYFDS